MTAEHKLPRRARTKKAAAVDVTKIGKLIRLLASDKPGEVTAAVGALKRALQAGGKDFHDVAGAVERGLQQPPQPPHQPWSPPLPSPHDWSSMSWWLHYNRHHLRKDQAERVADYLLGQAFCDSDGRCMPWHLDELRAMVARVRAELRTTSVVRR